MTSFGKAKARRKQAGAETGRMIVNRSFFLMRTNGPIVIVNGFSPRNRKNPCRPSDMTVIGALAWNRLWCCTGRERQKTGSHEYRRPSGLRRTTDFR
jgi:hypothetical protein